MAGNNRAQLEEVIHHYRKNNEKLKAAYFLISNMKYKGTYLNKLVDSMGKPIDFNISDFENEKEENKWLDSIQSIKGPLRSHEQFLPDLENITSQFLINNIDRAFEVKQKSPFCKGISISDFYEYILPYRIGTEKLEFWRDTILNSFTSEQKDSIYGFSTVLAAANYIDNIYQKNFEFGGRRYFKEKKIRSYSELMEDKKGKCNDMCNLVVMALRTIGIPSGFDGIRYKRGSNDIGHIWCFVLDTRTNKNYPFDALSNNGPGWFNLPYKNAPKVYRKQFAGVNENSIKKNYSVIHPNFFLNSSKDVTSEYFETTSISISLKKFYENPIYLNIWHKSKWTPVDYSYNPNSLYAFFENVTKDNLYCITSYNFFENKPIGKPFIINKFGELEYPGANNSKNIVSLNKHEHIQIENALKNTEILEFDKKRIIFKKIIKNDLNRERWVSTSTDSIYTNTLYIFSDSLNKAGQVFMFKNNGSIDWY